MIYWHMQMNQPWGRDGGTIDSTELLNLDDSVIGTGEWDDVQCRYFTGEDDRALEIGDFVLVREGKKPLAICEVTSDCFQDDELMKKFHHENYRTVDVLGWVNGNEKFPQVLGTLQRLTDSSTDSWKLINKWHREILKKQNMEKYTNILKGIKPQMILQGPPGTGKTFTAKDIAYSMIFDKLISSELELKKSEMKLLEDSGQYKLIQFHPAYSYEDFVRGITAKTNGSSIEYVTVNRILADFALKALKNYLDSHKSVAEISKEVAYENILEEFKDFVLQRLKESGKFNIPGTTANIIEVSDDSFKYNFPIRENIVYNLLYSDLVKLGLNSSSIIRSKDIDSFGLKMKGKSPYYFSILQKIEEFINDKKLSRESKEIKVVKKNYVLIIDEINRANLPAVLGELIYALEYRGESVEGMYELEGDRKMILPPNLYIIGTMNTADRSVGHIDYAIRRRFAFVDILPSADIIDKVITDPVLSKKAKNLYNAVSILFYEQKDAMDKTTIYLASDFKAHEVQLGHSYFLAETEEQLKLKLEYEIKPILNEYVKDGILLDDAREVINKLQVQNA